MELFDLQMRAGNGFEVVQRISGRQGHKLQMKTLKFLLSKIEIPVKNHFWSKIKNLSKTKFLFKNHFWSKIKNLSKTKFLFKNHFWSKIKKLSKTKFLFKNNFLLKIKVLCTKIKILPKKILLINTKFY